jgi:hypothetical protein
MLNKPDRRDALYFTEGSSNFNILRPRPQQMIAKTDSNSGFVSGFYSMNNGGMMSQVPGADYTSSTGGSST